MNPQMVFRKVCNEDGEPVGFAGWTVPRGTLASEMKSDDGGGKKCNGGKQQGHINEPPQSLDIGTWAEVLKKRMAERRRVLQGRETFGVSHHPNQVQSIAGSHGIY